MEEKNSNLQMGITIGFDPRINGFVAKVTVGKDTYILLGETRREALEEAGEFIKETLPILLELEEEA